MKHLQLLHCELLELTWTSFFLSWRYLSSRCLTYHLEISRVGFGKRKEKKSTTAIVGVCRKTLKPGGLDNFSMYKSTACISRFLYTLHFFSGYKFTLPLSQHAKISPLPNQGRTKLLPSGVGFISWSRKHGHSAAGHSAAVHSRGVWGHAPPGNFRCSEVHSGTFWGIQRSIFIIIACWATGILETISIG